MSVRTISALNGSTLNAMPFSYLHFQTNGLNRISEVSYSKVSTPQWLRSGVLPDLPPGLLGSEKIHGGGGIRGINSFISGPLSQHSPCRCKCALCSAFLSPPGVHQTKQTWLSWRLGQSRECNIRSQGRRFLLPVALVFFCSGEGRSGSPHGRRAGSQFLGSFSSPLCCSAANWSIFPSHRVTGCCSSGRSHSRDIEASALLVCHLQHAGNQSASVRPVLCCMAFLARPQDAVGWKTVDVDG